MLKFHGGTVMTMIIFLFALLAPLAYAVCNHIDKILLERYFKQGGVEVLMVFSALLSIIAMFVCYLIEPTVFQMAPEQIKWAMIVGLIDALLLWAYLKAMFQDNPAVVIVFYQLVPVIGLIMSRFWLGETITYVQFFGMALVIIGATIMSFLIDGDGKLRFRKMTVIYMTIASTCWAAESTIFKGVALETNVYQAFFWEHVALVLVGIVLMGIPFYRRSFLKAIKVNSGPILGANVVNEVLYQTGNLVAALVVVLIPVSLTLMMNSFQPLFVLILAFVMLTIYKSRFLLWAGYGLSRRPENLSTLPCWLVQWIGKVMCGTHHAFGTVEVLERKHRNQVLLSVTIMLIGMIFIGVIF